MLEENPESVFKSWLTEHGGAILKVARAYTFTTEDCQDLVQEILLQLWRCLPQFQGRASASTWIYRVALNTALGWHRKEHRRQLHQQAILDVEELPATGFDRRSKRFSAKPSNGSMQQFAVCPKPRQHSSCSTWTT